MDLLADIEAQQRAAPRRIAHRSSGGTMTWGELWDRSGVLAGALARAGLPAGSPIVLRGHKEPEMLTGFLGCARAGFPYVPVDTGVPESRLDHIVTAASAGLVLTPGDIRALEAKRLPAPPASRESAAPQYVMFTSGSTGEPKGVVITRGCLEAFLDWMVPEQGFVSGQEVFLNQAIFSFDLSVMDTWCSLVTGGTLVSLTAEEIGEFRRLEAALSGSDITTWVSTPAFAQLCLGDRRFAAPILPRLRRFLFCGDVLTPEVAGQLIDRFPLAKVWNTYGPTEATVATTSVLIDREILARYPQLPIGRPMPGTRVFLEGEDGAPVESGTRGEIVIEGPNVSPGYLGRADLTARAFGERNGVRRYRTGDWGVERDGLLFFGGRLDSQVKIAGYRIELGDVEAHLGSLPSVRGAVILPGFQNGRPNSLHAFVVLSVPPVGSDLVVGAAIRSQLAALLPSYMLPRKFHLLERFPLTANGKVDRAALAALIPA